MPAVRTMKPKDKAIRIRLSQADKEQIQKASRLSGVAVSDFIRSNALAAAAIALAEVGTHE